MIVWMYWENKHGATPSHIQKSMEHARKHTRFPLHIVNEKTIHDYIHAPELPPLKIAHKADVYRALLLHTYGGIWADADMIWIKNMDCIFPLDQLATIFTNGGSPHSPTRIECIGSQKGNPMMWEWHEAQMRVLEEKKGKIRWTDIGSSCLSPIVAKYKDQCKILPIRLLCPVEWNKWRTKDYMKFVTEETMAITYFNSQQSSLPKSLKHLLE